MIWKNIRISFPVSSGIVLSTKVTVEMTTVAMEVNANI
jgi:hypothetical protein